MTMYIGLDVHSKQTTFVAQNEKGDVIRQGKIPTTVESFRQFLDDLEVSPLTPIGLESGQQCRWVSRILASMEMKPIVAVKGQRDHSSSRKQRIFQHSYIMHGNPVFLT